jgi:hypothetical protein
MLVIFCPLTVAAFVADGSVFSTWLQISMFLSIITSPLALFYLLQCYALAIGMSS